MNGAKDFKCFPAYVEECFFSNPRIQQITRVV